MDAPKNWYICYHPACRKPFKRKQDWARHMETHLGITYRCPHCELKFTRQQSVNRHLPTCKQAIASNYKPKQVDATILNATPVKPITIGIAPERQHNDTPPKKSIVLSHTAWIATDKCAATTRAIKLLEKYKDNTLEPLKPTDFTKTQLASIKSKIKVPTEKTEFTWRKRASNPSDPGEGTSDGLRRKATIVPAHCSDLRAVKRHLTTEVEDTTPTNALMNESFGDVLPDLEELSTNLSNLEVPDIPPKKVKFRTPTPTTLDTPSTSQAQPNNIPPQDPQCMDGPGGSPFISDPDVEINTIWDEVLHDNNPVSPIVSPRDNDPSPLPNIQVVLPSELEDQNQLDPIGFISSSDSEEETTVPPPVSQNPTPMAETPLSVNETILDIICEMSVINDISLSKDLSKYQKALTRVHKILTRVNRRIAKM